jgi:hypothetical protein
VTGFYAWLAALAEQGTLPSVFQYAFFIRGLLAILLLAPLLFVVTFIIALRRYIRQLNPVAGETPLRFAIVPQALRVVVPGGLKTPLFRDNHS